MMGISMDKYKTSEMGKALKKVYRGEMTVKQSIALAQREIAEIFSHEATPTDAAEDRDIGFKGDKIGVCPLCGDEIVRGVYNYGCIKFREGCKFRIPLSLCTRPIPVTAAKSLLETGKTGVLNGFVSKAGKTFSAALKLEGNEVKFVFDDVPKAPRTPKSSSVFSASSRDYVNEELPPDFFNQPPDPQQS